MCTFDCAFIQLQSMKGWGREVGETNKMHKARTQDKETAAGNQSEHINFERQGQASHSSSSCRIIPHRCHLIRPQTSKNNDKTHEEQPSCHGDIIIAMGEEKERHSFLFYCHACPGDVHSPRLFCKPPYSQYWRFPSGLAEWHQSG